MTFEDLGLSSQTIQAINELGITQPTTVQADVIPSILSGKDVFTIAPGRCGKTCSYVFPLIDIISRNQSRNILIITADSAQSVLVSDRLAVFNKYHETTAKTDENRTEESNVIIASPDLLLEIVAEGKADLTSVNILIVDDINLIKKKRQLDNLQKVLEMLPADKQNIVFTNRRSKETQNILDQILKAPAEIKVDRNKEDEAAANTPKQEEPKPTKLEKEPKRPDPKPDHEAIELAQKVKAFGDKTPAFLLVKGQLAEDEF